MAGGALKYRHLSRKSSHRQALLRNLVTSLFTHESITTTWHKAKEAQRLAEKLITLGKKNTNASRRKAETIFFEPVRLLPHLFTTLRERYLERPGGYTRVLRIEPMNKHYDQAPSAILELVDGPKDMRFLMTAKTLVRERTTQEGVRELTAKNVGKVTRFRPAGFEDLEREVKRMEAEAGNVRSRKAAITSVDEGMREGHGERQPWVGGGRSNGK
ncbi:MAG: hypothetical protein LQ348_000884 [Seirophora lacunosa]|nr:MAG: hypothetical protein LQ344_007389 [Seirophora lacunosa]KAI4206648.1 MAG: hypothetical protein LQ348_000884 [Seirophora lacunosa]